MKPELSEEKPFGWAFIGVGTMAKQSAKDITGSKRHRIVSVYNRTYDKGVIMAQKYGACCYHTLKEAVTAVGVDAVYVATTANSHFEIAMECLKLKKSVLIEKPFTVTAKDAQLLKEAAEENEVYLAEAMWTWFSPVANKVKEWLDNGEIGTIQHAKFLYCIPSVIFAPRLWEANLCGGSLMDCGIYPITYAYRLFGMPDKITCVGHLKRGVDTDEQITFHYNNQVDVSIRCSMIKANGGESMDIIGSEGNIRNFLTHAAWKVKMKKKHQIKKTVFKGAGGILNEFDCVAREILEGKKVSGKVPISVTIDCLKILDECRMQMGLVYPFENKG